MTARVGVFVVLCLLCVSGSAAYAMMRAAQLRALEAPAPTPAAADHIQAILDQPHVVFLDTPDYSHRHIAIAPLADLDDRAVTDTTCARVYAVASGGLCLGIEGGVAYSYNARSFDAQLQPKQAFDIRGLPSRARVAPDGSLAATTVFVSGDSYGAPFSTRAELFDLRNGQDLGDLETFTVYRNGARIRAPDFNFWGVTFAADARHFFATLGSNNTTYLVEGELATHELRTLDENVECPSLSPDGRFVAFKQRVAGTIGEWRLAVLDLQTRHTALLNETRSVDDQVAWLDDETVLYAISEVRRPGELSVDIWSARLDGQEPPRVFLRDALSPAVVRP